MKFSMITYNIRGDFWSPELSSALAGVIKEHDVDMVCLQEVTSYHGNSEKTKKKRDILEEINKRLGGYYGMIDFLPVQTPLFSMGNGFLYKKSKVFPVGKSFSKYFAPITERNVIEVLFSRFMLRRRRVILSQKFRIKKTNIILYNVHLDFYGGDLKKIFQLGHFFRFWDADRQKKNTFEFVTGDFNTWASYKFLNLWKIFSILRTFMISQGFSELTKDIDWTCSFDMVEAEAAVRNGVLRQGVVDKVISRMGHLYKQKLDYTWLKGRHKLLLSKRLDFAGSDHSPILVEVDLVDENNTDSE